MGLAGGGQGSPSRQVLEPDAELSAQREAAYSPECSPLCQEGS